MDSAGEGSDFDMMMASTDAAAPAGSDTRKITNKLASLSLSARVKLKYGDRDADTKTSATSVASSAVSGVCL